MPISLLKNAGQKNSKNHWKHRSLTWLRNTRLLVSGAVFMQKSYGSVQGFSTPVGLQLGWLEWCGARGLSMSYFTQVLREITELTSLELFLSHSTRSQSVSFTFTFSPHFCHHLLLPFFLLILVFLSPYLPFFSPLSLWFYCLVYVVFPSWLIWINCQALNELLIMV